MKFECVRHNTQEVTIHLSQEAFISNLLIQNKLHGEDVNKVITPYRSGFPIDKIPYEPYNAETQQQYTTLMQSLVGSFAWLSMSTRPDLATVTNMIAKYVKKPTKGHITAAKRVLRLKVSYPKELHLVQTEIPD